MPRTIWLLMVVWLPGCSVEHFDRPGAAGDEALYTLIYPYYAEFCALSQIKKKLGYGADIRGEIGGHSVFYLNGACREPAVPYDTLHLCEPQADGSVDGVGLSMNAHFSNAKWVATPGRAFFFDGDLPPGHGVTRADYDTVQARAKQLGIYRGVVFHSEVFDDKPNSFSQEDYKYEVSIATDYGISLGRGRFCARVPVTRAQMAQMIDYLNSQNAPYRDGRAVFHWSVFQDNCIHLAHNALSVAGVWQEWPINQPFVVAVFDFPVPKNEFVNLMRRTNDPADVDPLAIYHDQTAGRSLVQFDQLPFMPGALAESRPPQRPNEIYETELKLIFYDDPILGHYQQRFDAMFRDPRYFDLGQNLRHFAGLYARIEDSRRPLETWLAQGEFRTPAARQRFADFYGRFYAYVSGERGTVDANLVRLRTETPTAGNPPMLVSANPK